ncbi:TetR/AcrR family transcriptional regulator [Mucilaginibacter aquaedulcis]|uniref:TetR/AcrR family transcriptional regulator n=1 Tax=Mucilaginibacter aquaedulcis TaxID=1187081 RepID=UPI0025B46BDA|nr:TetR/AcrR family transcriptional regulator [Mucilaginibacter aquaedulcis]MDN3548865.1 TetR/AcrR family transcriptional regulator [Mucilaginibacter aquaedulcis]
MNAWTKKVNGDKIKADIHDAIIKLVDRDGWDNLSIAKIAVESGYSGSTVYRHYQNKNTLLSEFTREGYLLLYREVVRAGTVSLLPALRLNHMWQAYWNFAFTQQKYYRLMFGVGTSSCRLSPCCPELKCFVKAFITAMRGAVVSYGKTEERVDAEFYTYWSVVHGLICLNFQQNEFSRGLNNMVLMESFHAIANTFQASVL